MTATGGRRSSPTGADEADEADGTVEADELTDSAQADATERASRTMRPLIIEGAALDRLLPHRPPMRLLQRVVAVDLTDRRLAAELVIAEADPWLISPEFGSTQKVWPRVLAIEALAQAVAAWVSLEAEYRTVGGDFERLRAWNAAAAGDDADTTSADAPHEANTPTRAQPGDGAGSPLRGVRGVLASCSAVWHGELCAGDRVSLAVHLEQRLGEAGRARGTAFVAGRLVVEASLLLVGGGVAAAPQRAVTVPSSP